jgi:hypothetical protein
MRVARIAVVLAVFAAIGGASASAIELVEATLPDAIVGSPYSFQFQGEEGCPASYHFKISSGALPPGMTLSDKGLMTGTPTEAGSYGFYIDLGDDCVGDSHTQRQYFLNVVPRLVVTTTALAPGRVGAPYSVQLTAAGGGTQSWSVSDGALPGGLTLSATGLLSGTPSAAGSFTFTVKVADAARSGTQQLTLVVAAPLAVVAPTTGVGEIGVPFNATPTASGGATPLTWTVTGAMPTGLSLNASTGAISGIPLSAGTFPITLSASSADGQSVSAAMTLRIAARLAVATRRLPVAHLGEVYSTRLSARGGVPPVSWALARGTLPAGIRLSSTGRLGGKPKTARTATVVVRVTDRLGGRATQKLVLTVSVS